MTDEPPLKLLPLLIFGVMTFSAPPEMTALPMIRGNSLIAMGSPPSNNEVLASLADFSERDIIKRIILAESSNNPNAKNPHSSAKGLLQVIDSTARECEEHFGREMNMYLPEDNLLCGKYLYESYGLSPWRASRHKWEK